VSSRTIPTSSTTESEPVPSPGALAAAFLTIALASFGGGLSAWAQRVLVERRRWIDQDEFLSALTLCRLMPGPNQVNMAVYVGTKFRGVPGALAAVAGLVVIPTAILLVLGAIYFRYRQLPALDAALRGAVAGAAAMTIAMGLKVGRPLLHDPGGMVLALAAFVAVHVLRWPLVPVVAVLGPLGVLWAWPRRPAARTSS
jgi:chromate transporter